MGLINYRRNGRYNHNAMLKNLSFFAALLCLMKNTQAFPSSSSSNYDLVEDDLHNDRWWPNNFDDETRRLRPYDGKSINNGNENIINQHLSKGSLKENILAAIASVLESDMRQRLLPSSSSSSILKQKINQYNLARSNNKDQQQQPPMKRRGGSCLFHAGLASNCDYRDLIGAVNEINHWGSEMAPGKKRKRMQLNRRKRSI